MNLNRLYLIGLLAAAEDSYIVQVIKELNLGGVVLFRKIGTASHFIDRLTIR